VGTEFLYIIWTDYVVACFPTSFDIRKYLDLRQRRRDVLAQKLRLRVVLPVTHVQASTFCCTGQYLVLYRPVPCAVQASTLCCTGQYLVLYRPVPCAVQATTLCCTGQYLVLYRPLPCAVQATTLCCTGHYLVLYWWEAQ